MLLDNECNKMRNPESLLEFVSTPHFPAHVLVLPEEIINGEHNWTAVAAWVRLGAGEAGWRHGPCPACSFLPSAQC